MSVGLVVVSHSAALASGVRELAAQMAPGVAIEVAGGTDDGGIGTSFELVTAALTAADTGDGVVVLYDLGSALLTTETALEFAGDDEAARILVVDAPLVEGAIAAGVAAEAGSDLAAVAAAARAAADTWLGGRTTVPNQSDVDATATATVADAVGIHARPASILARELNTWPAAVVALARTDGSDPVDPRNVLALIGLGLRQGEQVVISGAGDGAADAVARLAELIDTGMD